MIDKLIEKAKEEIDNSKEPAKKCIIKVMRDELANNLAAYLREIQLTLSEFVEYVYLTMKMRGLV